MTTISGKGQIVVPVGLREELKLGRGQQLIVLKRKDGKGFTCLKEDTIEDIFKKLADK